MVCTCVSGNSGSMDRTVARSAFSICSGGSSDRSTMYPPLPFRSVGDASEPASSSAWSTGT